MTGLHVQTRIRAGEGEEPEISCFQEFFQPLIDQAVAQCMVDNNGNTAMAIPCYQQALNDPVNYDITLMFCSM